jgi:hypothetical protein
VDVVEVLRGTAAGPLLIAAGAVGVVAAVATAVAVPTWWTAPRTGSGRRPAAWLLELAFAATTIELVLLLLDGAGLTDRWPAVSVVRLALLLGLAVLPRPQRPVVAPPDPPGSDRVARAPLLAAGLSLALLATSVLGAPSATGALGTGPRALALAAALVLVLVATTIGVVRLGAARGGVAAGVGPLVLLLVVAVPAAVGLAPDRLPPYRQVQLAVEGVALDLTVAPASPGTNEFHLYAFGPDGRPTTVREVSVEVVGTPTSRHQLFEVSPDHHLSYVLELPPTPPWVLRVRLAGPDGAAREADWTLAPPG